MNQLTCPACATTQKIASQFDSTTGALVILECGHAWELVHPHARDEFSEAAERLVTHTD